MKQIVYALRYVLKARWDNIAKILSLSLGLTLGLVVFSMVFYQLSFDRYLPDRNRIYQMQANYTYEGKYYEGASGLWGPIAPALQEDMSEVEVATRLISPMDMIYFYGENSFRVEAIVGDSTLFDVLGAGVLAGDPRTALTVNNSMMISESLALRIAGGENPVGKQMMYNNTPITIAGIFRDIPQSSHYWFDAVLSFPCIELIGCNYEWGAGGSFVNYIKLREGASLKSMEAKLPAFFAKYGMENVIKDMGYSFYFVPVDKVYSSYPDVVRRNIILGILGFMVIFIAAMNFVLLSLASLSGRAKTVGMYKCNGASDGNIFSMFFIETVVYIIVSLVVALGLILLFSGVIETFTGESLSTLFGASQLKFLALVLLLLVFFAAIIPARAFAAIPVTSAFRASLASHRLWKNVLLFIQFAAVSFVAVYTVIVVRQYDMLTNKDLGYNYKNVLYAPLPNVTPDQLEAVRREMIALPDIEDVSFMAHLMRNMSGQPAFDLNTHEILFLSRRTWMDSNTIPLFGMRMVYGENFTPEMGAEYAIVNQKYAAMMRWTDDPTGRLITDAYDGSRVMTIAGVVEDFTTGSLHFETEPVVIHPAAYYLPYTAGRLYANIMIRVREISPEQIEAVQDRLSTMLPGTTIEVKAFGDTIASQYEQEKLLKDTVTMVTMIIVSIAIIGITGYLEYEMRRRRREIAIRKVLGALSGDILLSISRIMLFIVAASISVGAAAGYFAGAQWLHQFVHKIPLNAWILVSTSFFVLLTVVVTIVVRTRSILNENPVKSLKSE